MTRLIAEIDRILHALPEMAAKSALEHRWTDVLLDFAGASHDLLEARARQRKVDLLRIQARWDSLATRLFDVAARAQSLHLELAATH